MKPEEAQGRLENATWSLLFGADDLWGSAKVKDKMVFRQPLRRFLLRAGGGGRAVTHVGVIDHLCHVNGSICTVAGIGSVTTIADERKKGYARDLIRFVLGKLREEKRARYAILFCFEELESFFKKMGWERVNGKVQVLQPSKQSLVVKKPYVVMFCKLRSAADPAVFDVWLESFPW